MTQPLRIVVADDEPDMRQYFRKILPRLGHQVVGVAENGHELVAQCLALQPDLVITDIKMPGLDGIEAAARIFKHRPVPVILVSAYQDPELVERAESDHVLGYLVKPIKQADLGPVIALVMRRFGEMQQLRQETADLRHTLEEQQLIGQARELLMRRAGLDEGGATRQLQQRASATNVTLAEAARMVLAAEEPDVPPLS